MRTAMPFVGRDTAMSRLDQFVASARKTDRLIAFWVQGETGMGKSRLVEEFTRSLPADTLPVVARFHSDSPLSSASVLFEAFAAAFEALGESVESPARVDIAASLSVIRKAIRRYHVVLFIEDIHVLEEETAAELSGILHGIQDESVALVCTAQPSAHTTYGILLRYIVASVELEPLNADQFRTILSAYDIRPELLEEYLDTIVRKLHGIPLAIWAFVHGLLTQSEELDRFPASLINRILNDVSASIARGFTRNLSAQAMEGGRLFAQLGSVFSATTARILSPRASEYCHELIEANIISQLVGPSIPLVGTSDPEPVYMFTHSLVQEHLLTIAPPPGASIIDVVLSDAPIHTTTPFTVAATVQADAVGVGAVERIFRRLTDVARQLYRSPHWKSAVALCAGAHTLLASNRERFDPELYDDHEIELLLIECEIHNAYSTSKLFRIPKERLLELTSNPQSDRRARFRILALRYAVFDSELAWRFETTSILEEASGIVGRFPNLRLDQANLDLLSTLASGLRVSGSSAQIPLMRKELGRVLDTARDSGMSEAYRTALLYVAPSLLSVFETRAEFEDRLALADRIFREIGGEKPVGMMYTAWPRFLEVTGRVERASSILDSWIHEKLTGQDLAPQFTLRLQRVLIRAALGAPLQQIAREAKDAADEYNSLHPSLSNSTASHASVSVGAHLILAGLMSGHEKESREFARSIVGDASQVDAYMMFVSAALAQDRERLRTSTDRDPEATKLKSLIDYVLDPESASRERAIRTARETLESDVLRRHNVLRNRVVISLIEMTNDVPSQSIAAELADSVQDAIRRSLSWLRDHNVVGFAAPLSILAQRYLNREDVEALDLKEIQPLPASAPLSDGDGVNLSNDHTVHLSAFNSIRIGVNDEPMKSVRGGRKKRLIALLIANQLLENPVDLDTFREVVAQRDTPKENANYLRIMVSRLRKDIGQDAIRTVEDGPPELNLDVVDVDIVTADRFIGEANEYAFQCISTAAVDTLERALGILSRGAPCPEIEGAWIDACRREFQSRLASCIDRVRACVREYDGDSDAIERIDALVTDIASDYDLDSPEISAAEK